MTDEQFDVVLKGAGIASRERLYHLSNLLTAASEIGQTPTQMQLDALYDWTVKVAQDLVNHDRKQAVA